MKKILAGIMFFSLIMCGTAFADLSVQDYLNSIGATNATKLQESPKETDAYWEQGGTGIASATMMVEFAGWDSTNSFGLFDSKNDANMLQVFPGASGAGDKVSITFTPDSGGVDLEATDLITHSLISSAHFAGNTFGFYFDSSNGGTNPTGGLFFSDSSLNTDSKYDHMWAYQDNSYDALTTGGHWLQNEYALAWEDTIYPGTDGDHNDMIVMVESVKPVPEPGTLMLLGSGLMGIAFYRRRRKVA